MANEQPRNAQNPIPTGATLTERPTTDVIYVGCKLPNGLVLELIGSGHDWKPAPTGERLVLKGANNVREPGLLGSQGQHPYSLTAVNRSFWEQWLKANQHMPFVKNGQVFAVPETGSSAAAKKSAKDMAKERMPIKTGLEALNPAVDEKGRIKDERLKSVAVKGRTETQVASDPDHLASLMNGMMDAA